MLEQIAITLDATQYETWEVVSQQYSDEMLLALKDKLQAKLVNTNILGVSPSKIPGMLRVKLENGNIGYTDTDGEFFIFGLIFDLDRGDVDKALDGSKGD